jgi:hypothetical protein
MEDIRMKLAKFAAGVCAILLTMNAFGQDDRPTPVPPGTILHELYMSSGPNHNPAQPPTLTGSNIPTWSYSVVSPVDGKTYKGTIMGANPATKPGKITDIPTVVIPIRLEFKYSASSIVIFDPTAVDPGCLGTGNTAYKLTQASPLFNDAAFKFGATTVGTTQYIDAFQRANFWKDVSASPNYHTLLGFTPYPVQTVIVPSASTGSPDGTVYTESGQCGSNTGNVNIPGGIGVMSFGFWDSTAQSLITKLGITPNTFVFFLFYNSVMSSGTPTNLNTCCILGYHDIVGGQTYGNGEFEGREQTLFTGTADTSALSHELAEWMNDPNAANPTPSWGHIGQVSGCQGNYEVGDPLSGTLMPAVKMPNGFSYHLQEMAFFDWFYRVSPSIGVNGWYSNNGTFTTDAGAVCN